MAPRPGGDARGCLGVWRDGPLADTLTRLAREGPDEFYTGPVAEASVAKVTNPPAGATPGRMGLEDLRSYRAEARQPACTFYRRWEICGFPPPSSGGLAVAQIMGMLEHFDLAAYAPQPALAGEAVHLIAEAMRLAYADRDHYVADPAYVTFPGGSWRTLLDTGYLRARAAMIAPNRSMGTALPGDPSLARAAHPGRDLPETTHVSLVDSYGNALAMTSSIEGGFGSFMAVEGFLLNNQLTDFSPVPADAAGLTATLRRNPQP